MVKYMDEYTRISHKSYSLKEEEKVSKKIKYLRSLITRSLLSIILVISICICIKFDQKYEGIINNYLFNVNTIRVDFNEKRWKSRKSGL